jgi:predicted alpha/beta-fold hydrolase
VPAWSLPRQAEVAKHVTLWQPERGGHNGFASGRFPGRLLAMPQRVLHWLSSHGGSGFAHG